MRSKAGSGKLLILQTDFNPFSKSEKLELGIATDEPTLLRFWRRLTQRYAISDFRMSCLHPRGKLVTCISQDFEKPQQAREPKSFLPMNLETIKSSFGIFLHLHVLA